MRLLYFYPYISPGKVRLIREQNIMQNLYPYLQLFTKSYTIGTVSRRKLSQSAGDTDRNSIDACNRNALYFSKCCIHTPDVTINEQCILFT